MAKVAQKGFVRCGSAVVVLLAVVAGLSCRVTENEKHLWLSSYRIYYPGDVVVVELQSHGVDEVDMAVYSLDLKASPAPTRWRRGKKKSTADTTGITEPWTYP
jgi:hypothetical protein